MCIVMKMSPIKKIVIGLAAITVALSLITAKNMASVMLIVASREAGSAAQQSVQTNAPVQSQTNNNSQSSSQASVKPLLCPAPQALPGTSCATSTPRTKMPSAIPSC